MSNDYIFKTNTVLQHKQRFMNNKNNDIPFKVILVHATSHAIRGEKVINKAGLRCRLIPVPRHLSSDCGVCLRILDSDEEKIKSVLESNNIQWLKIEYCKPNNP